MRAIDAHRRAAGLHAELRSSIRGGPALFLDRDGVVVEEKHYLHRVEDVALTAGAGDAIAAINRLGVAVVLITNQAGIGRGIFDWEAFGAVQDEVHRRLAACGARLDAVYACAYHAEAKPPFREADHAWRKPNSGMLDAAAADLGLDLSGSWVVGDRASDLAAGAGAGLAGGTLVATGYGCDPAEIAGAARLATAVEDRLFATCRAETLADAIATLLSRFSRGR